MIAVLDEVEILDQEIVAARAIAQKLADLLERLVFDLASLRKSSRPLARADMSCRPVRAAALWGL
jgi:hypothetical protein